jgi:hypothetical protein
MTRWEQLKWDWWWFRTVTVPVWGYRVQAWFWWVR